MKTFEQECSADPMFKKMCAQFDEMGGMHGMLQTTLPMQADTLALVLEPTMPANALFLASSDDGGSLGASLMQALGMRW